MHYAITIIGKTAARPWERYLEKLSAYRAQKTATHW